MNNQEITIEIVASNAYQVTIANGLLYQVGEKLHRALPKCAKVLILSDDRVSPLYAERVSKSLEQQGISWALQIIPQGEKSKTPQTWLSVVYRMVNEGLCRDDALIALGGGVVGDIGGFAAACYLRGIACVQLPTSLLAMIDSSVGGKTAVDLPGGKNLLGCFAQPAMVLCDPTVLETLSRTCIIDGIAESFKMALLGNKALLEIFRTKTAEKRFPLLIEQSIRDKAEYVQRDERDNGLRHMLNLGHTFGHAIEKCSDYAISHGHAVSMGIACASRLSCRLGLMAADDCRHVLQLMESNALPVECPYTAATLYPHLHSDKKRENSGISFILPTAVGKCEQFFCAESQWMDWLIKATEECR